MNNRIKITVRIRSWNSMMKEFGLHRHGSIAAEASFTEQMRQYCSKMTVLIPNTYGGWQTFDRRWNISKDMVCKKYHYLMD